MKQMSNLAKMIEEVQHEMRAARNYSCADKLDKILEEARKDRWIPFSEREPEGHMVALVTIEIDLGSFKEYSRGIEVFGENGLRSRALKDNEKYIAWKPLPEPYRGEEA